MALIITVVLMLILVSVGISFGRKAINTAQLEDVKTEMLSIKARAKIIVDEYNYDDIEELPGVPTTTQDLNTLGVEGDNYYYTWDRETLNEQGLNNIEENVYVVHYDIHDDLENPSNCEVYYLEGINGKHSLTQLLGEE